MQKIKSIIFDVESRFCESCGTNDFDLIWENKTTIKRRNYIWIIKNNVSICRNCGFCFCSPAPNKKQLKQYYEDGNIGYKEISLPYSIDERLRILEKYKVEDGLFIEIGGDAPLEFHNKCNDFFKDHYSIEVSKELKNKSNNIEKFNDSVDVIAHYDVLEHVIDIKGFLNNCYKALKSDGVMICEVPNLALYPKNLLLLEAEHVNHFTILSLSRIAFQVGFHLIEFDNNASRPYGFVAIFKKNKNVQKLKFEDKNEYSDSKKYILGGLKQIEKNNKFLKLLTKKVNKLSENGQKIVLWGVTDLMRSLLRNFNVRKNIIILDSDPRRKDDLILNNLPVKQPINCKEELLSASLLIICAPRYASEILKWIKINIGKTFNGKSLDIIGVNSEGKTLR